MCDVVLQFLFYVCLLIIRHCMCCLFSFSFPYIVGQCEKILLLLILRSVNIALYSKIKRGDLSNAMLLCLLILIAINVFSNIT